MRNKRFLWLFAAFLMLPSCGINSWEYLPDSNTSPTSSGHTHDYKVVQEVVSNDRNPIADTVTVKKCSYCNQTIREYSSYKGYSFYYDIDDSAGCVTLNSIDIAVPSKFSGVVIVPSHINNKPVKYISEGAFYSPYITSIDLPQYVESLSPNTFTGAINLETVTVQVDNVNYTSNNGILFDKDMTTLIYFPARHNLCESYYSIPNSVTTIGQSAFAGSNIREILIPASVTTIKAYAFMGCYHLRRVDAWDSNVHIIEESAFKNCYNLNRFYLPQFFHYNYDSIYTNQYGENNAFQYCYNLVEVFYSGWSPMISLVPGGIDYGRIAFYAKWIKYDRYSTSIIGDDYSNTIYYFEDNMKYILGLDDENSTYVAFTQDYLNPAGCYIRDYAFYDTPIQEIRDEYNTYGVDYYCTRVRHIGNYAFARSNIKEFYFGTASTIEVGYYAFENCDNLYTVGMYSLSDFNTIFPDDPYNSNDCNAFHNCYRLVYLYSMTPGDYYSMLYHIGNSQGYGQAFTYCKEIRANNMTNDLIVEDDRVVILQGEYYNYLVRYNYRDLETVDNFTITGSYEEILPYAFSGKLNNGEVISNNYINSLNFSITSYLYRIDEKAFYKANIRNLFFECDLNDVSRKAFCNAYIDNLSFYGSITYLHQYAFNSSYVINLTFRKSIGFIEANAFSDSFYFKRVAFNFNNFPTLQNNTFAGARIEELVLPSKETRITYELTSGIIGICRLVVPISVTNVAEGSLANVTAVFYLGRVDYNDALQGQDTSKMFSYSEARTGTVDKYWHYTDDGHVDVWGYCHLNYYFF